MGGIPRATRRAAADFERLFGVWHEAAIPSALVRRSTRLGKLNGLALWGGGRERPLAELMEMLIRHDFVHPIKLSRYAPAAVRGAYLAVAGA